MQAQIVKRIKSARIMAGLSRRELCDKLNGSISLSSIGKYERGEKQPDMKILIELSKVLNVPIDYFLRTQSVDIGNIEFRKKNSLPRKKEDTIKENIKDNIERYIELESFFDFNSTFQNPLNEIAISNSDDVEKAVEKLLRDWDLGINALPSVIEMLEDKGIKVIEIDADEKFDGLSFWANKNIPIIGINKNWSVERKRFTSLHELGHLLLNINKDNFTHKEIEKFCNVFAGAMLLPKPSIFKELGNQRDYVSLKELIIIKESYGISIQAIMARAKDLKIITDDQFIQFRKRVNQNENLKKEIGFGEYKGTECSSWFKQLLYRATAEGIISMSKAASLSNLKLAQFRDEFMAI